MRFFSWIADRAREGFPILQNGLWHLLGTAPNSPRSGPNTMAGQPPIFAEYAKIWAALGPLLMTVLTEGWAQIVAGIVTLAVFWRVPQRTSGQG